MKNVVYTLSGMVALAAVIFSVASKADDQASLDQLPDGSVISIPVNATIDAELTSYGLPLEKLDAQTQMDCSIQFPSSNSDRSLQGQLTISISSASTVTASVVDYDNSNSRGATILLNGEASPITSLTCAVEALNSAGSVAGYEPATIGNLRQYLSLLGGSLTLSPPVPFGQ